MRCLVILTLILCSCNIKHGNELITQTKDQDSLVNELVNADFLQYTDSSKIESVRQSFINDGYIFGSEINRYVHIDAEELTEGSFDFFRTDLTRILKKRGFEVTFSTTENFETLHEVMINNEAFALFDDKNLTDNSFWDIGPRRFFDELNKELEKRKLQERFYLIYGGNDLGAILLTERQFSIIAKINEGNTKEIPYKP